MTQRRPTGQAETGKAGKQLQAMRPGPPPLPGQQAEQLSARRCAQPLSCLPTAPARRHPFPRLQSTKLHTLHNDQPALPGNRVQLACFDSEDQPPEYTCAPKSQKFLACRWKRARSDRSHLSNERKAAESLLLPPWIEHGTLRLRNARSTTELRKRTIHSDQMPFFAANERTANIVLLNHRQPGSMLCDELCPHSTHVRTIA